MPKVRGPDGTPIVVPTRPGKADERVAPGREKPESDYPGLRIEPQHDRGEAETKPPLERRPSSASPDVVAREISGEAPTVYGGSAPQGAETPRATPQAGGRPEAEERHPELRSGIRPAPAPADFATAWLVIVDGPGKGAALQLGMGPHKIGRSQESRLCLNFGDFRISRNHASLTYDPRGNAFYVQQDDNLVYLRQGEELHPVLTPTVLENGTELVIGRTRLRFVRLCGDSFTWR